MKKEAINTTKVTLPKGVEIRAKKTSVTFVRGEKKAILKGHALEITNPIQELGKRMKRYTDDVIQKCHLGSIKGVVTGIEDSVDLEKVLTKYFKTSSKTKTTKTAKAVKA